MDGQDRLLVGWLIFAGALLVVSLIVGAIVNTGNQRECRVKMVTEQHVTADEAERICQ